MEKEHFCYSVEGQATRMAESTPSAYTQAVPVGSRYVMCTKACSTVSNAIVVQQSAQRTACRAQFSVFLKNRYERFLLLDLGNPGEFLLPITPPEAMSAEWQLATAPATFIRVDGTERRTDDYKPPLVIALKDKIDRRRNFGERRSLSSSSSTVTTQPTLRGAARLPSEDSSPPSKTTNQFSALHWNAMDMIQIAAPVYILNHTTRYMFCVNVYHCPDALKKDILASIILRTLPLCACQTILTYLSDTLQETS